MVYNYDSSLQGASMFSMGFRLMVGGIICAWWHVDHLTRQDQPGGLLVTWSCLSKLLIKCKPSLFSYYYITHWGWSYQCELWIRRELTTLSNKSSHQVTRGSPLWTCTSGEYKCHLVLLLCNWLKMRAIKLLSCEYKLSKKAYMR